MLKAYLSSGQYVCKWLTRDKGILCVNVLLDIRALLMKMSNQHYRNYICKLFI